MSDQGRPDKRIAMRTVCRGRKFDVLIGGIDEMSAFAPERIVVNGYEVTDADLDRGWIDPDAISPAPSKGEDDE